jgi:hypothetical protein
MSLNKIQKIKQNVQLKAKTITAASYNYLSWRKLPALVIFFLAIYLISIRTSKKGAEYSGESTKDIFQLINNTCSVIPFSAPNKPEGMIVNSMYSSEDYGSPDDPNVMKYFTTPKLLSLEREKAYNGGITAMNQKTLNDAVAVYSKHDAGKPYETALIFSGYVTQLGRLKKLHLRQAYANKIKMGFCGEHASHTALALLQLSVKKQINIPIKIVGAVHAYVMIGSDLVDVDIEYDDNAVYRYVQSAEQNNHFSTGFICDSWNEGFFSKASTNKIALYKASDIREHEVNVVTYSLDFDLSLFSSETASYFKNELEAMGLESLHGKPTLDLANYKSEALEDDKIKVRELRR